MSIVSEHNDIKLTRKLIIAIGIIATIFFIKLRWIDGDGKGWKVTVESDGRGYYAYLPAVFLYQDQYFDFVERGEASIYGIGAAQQIYLGDGQRGNKYFIGVSIMLTPFFLLAWLISFIAGLPLTGYNVVFFTSVAIASLFYLIVALIFLRKLLLLYDLREKWIRVMLVIMVFGTNVFHYAVYEPSMSHIYSFAAVTMFLYYIKSFQLKNNQRHLVYAAILLAVIALIRPVNGMIILGIPFLTGSWEGFKKFVTDLLKYKSALLLSIFCFSVIAFIQPFFYFLVYGNFFRWPYSNEGFDFLHPHFWDALFSYRKGLFIYTPLMFLSFLFIIPYFRRSVFASLSYILFFVFMIWIISSWSTWFYGGSFSLRPVMEYYSFLILPLAVAINGIKKGLEIVLIKSILAIITAFCILQTYQYQNHLINYGEMTKEMYWKVFLKTDRRLNVITYPPRVEKISADSIVLRKTIILDFESPIMPDTLRVFDGTEHFSGSHSFKAYNKDAFSPGFRTHGDSLLKDEISYTEISLYAMVKDFKSNAALVVSFELPTGQIYRYDSYPIGMLMSEKNTWEKMSYSLKLPNMQADDIMSVYVWNAQKEPVFIDDMKIEMFSLKFK